MTSSCRGSTGGVGWRYESLHLLVLSIRSAWMCYVDHRADSRFAPTNERRRYFVTTSLFWLGANLESALWPAFGEMLEMGCVSSFKLFILLSISMYNIAMTVCKSTLIYYCQERVGVKNDSYEWKCQKLCHMYEWIPILRDNFTIKYLSKLCMNCLHFYEVFFLHILSGF